MFICVYVCMCVCVCVCVCMCVCVYVVYVCVSNHEICFEIFFIKTLYEIKLIIND